MRANSLARCSFDLYSYEPLFLNRGDEPQGWSPLLLAYSLANGISQGKGKDFPIIWEVFVGDGYGDLKTLEFLDDFSIFN